MNFLEIAEDLQEHIWPYVECQDYRNFVGDTSINPEDIIIDLTNPIIKALYLADSAYEYDKTIDTHGVLVLTDAASKFTDTMLKHYSDSTDVCELIKDFQTILIRVKLQLI